MRKKRHLLILTFHQKDHARNKRSGCNPTTIIMILTSITQKIMIRVIQFQKSAIRWGQSNTFLRSQYQKSRKQLKTSQGQSQGEKSLSQSQAKSVFQNQKKKAKNIKDPNPNRILNHKKVGVLTERRAPSTHQKSMLRKKKATKKAKKRGTVIQETIPQNLWTLANCYQ